MTTVSEDDFDRLGREHRALIREYGHVQSRCSEVIAEQGATIKKLQAELMQLRAAVIARDTALAYAREQHASSEAAVPGLPKRLALVRQVQTLTERLQSLLRERVKQHVPTTSEPTVNVCQVPTGLQHKSVLCIGTQDNDFAAAKSWVEQAGGRFLHRDDTDIDDPQALEESLAAADLVICQTGCVSHNAYWRVQDHCKRTGKQCVLVDQPQAIHFMKHQQTTITD